MIANVKFIHWSRIVFCLIILCIVWLWATSAKLNISTSLADLSPKNSFPNNIDGAIESINQDIQHRILLLIRGKDEDSVLDAESLARDNLANIPQLTVVDSAEDIAFSLIELLEPYRFSLLNEQQRDLLHNQSDVQILQQAKSSLYSLGHIRPYDFNKDPLGWHGDFITNLITLNQANSQDTAFYHSIVSLKIDHNAMDMQLQQSLSDELNRVISETVSNHEVKIDRSGVFFFAADASTNSKQDIGFITTGSMVGVVILLLLAFRSLRSLALPIVSLLVGVAFAFVVSHTIYGHIHILTIVFGASLIGIVIDYALHFFYHKAFSHTQKNQEIKNRSDAALHTALLLSLTTSIIGYAALSFSSLQALQKVAVFSCCGLFAAWVTVVCIGDLLTRKKITLDQTLIPALQSVLSDLTAKLSRPIWLCLSVSVIFLTGLFISQQNIFSDDPRLFYTASPELLNSEKIVASTANDFEPGRFIVVYGNNQKQVYQRTKAFYDRVKATPSLDANDLTSIVNWVPSQEQQHQNYQLQERLYAQNGLAAKLLAELSSSPQDSLTALNNEYIAAKDKLLRPKLIADFLAQSAPSVWHESNKGTASFILIQKGKDHPLFAKIANDIDGVAYINSLAETTSALTQQRKSATQLLLLAYVFVGLLLLLRYRSIKYLSMLLVPLSASCFVILICTFTAAALNLFHVMVLFLVLGFGMDYIIFNQELSDQKAITQQAIVLSAITSLISFGLLSLSSVPVAQSFGLSLLIGNSFNLLGVFVYSHFQKTAI